MLLKFERRGGASERASGASSAARALWKGRRRRVEAMRSTIDRLFLSLVSRVT